MPSGDAIISCTIIAVCSFLLGYYVSYYSDNNKDKFKKTQKKAKSSYTDDYFIDASDYTLYNDISDYDSEN